MRITFTSIEVEELLDLLEFDCCADSEHTVKQITYFAKKLRRARNNSLASIGKHRHIRRAQEDKERAIYKQGRDDGIQLHKRIQKELETL